MPFYPRIRDRVLVVDDTDLVREFLAELLSRSFDVTTAASGPEALAKVEVELPKVAVIDYDLPGMMGDALAESLKVRCPETVLILHSARTFEPGHPARAPFDFYLQKPVIRIADLERTVRLALAVYGARASALAV